MFSTAEPSRPASVDWLPCTDQCMCCAGNRQRGRAVASHVPPLKLQAVVHDATLGKLRKEVERAAQRLSATRKLAVLRNALAGWDADTDTKSEVGHAAGTSV